MLFSLPGQTAGLGPFKEHLMAALDVTSWQLSVTYMIGTVVSGLFLPTIGGVFDRIGVRKVGVAASIALGLALIVISQLDRILRFFAGGTPLWLSLPAVTLTFFAIRFWGQGVFSIISRIMIGKWFDRKRGLASAISGVPVAIAFTCALLTLYYIMQWLGGWRQAWMGIGLFLVSFGAFFCWLVFRDNPEECGLEIDGGSGPANEKDNDPEFAIHKDFTAPEALRTFAFWVFAAYIGLNGFIGTALGFHAPSLSAELGMTEHDLYRIFAKTIFINIPASFVIGWMTGRFRLKYSYLLASSSMGFGMYGFTQLGTTFGEILYVVGTGISWGAFGTLLTVTWPRYYGRRHLGKISSWVAMIMVISSALGPVFFDLSEITTSGYMPAVFVGVALSFVLFFLCLNIVNPQRKLAPKGD